MQYVLQQFNSSNSSRSSSSYVCDSSRISSHTLGTFALRCIASWKLPRLHVYSLQETDTTNEKIDLEEVQENRLSDVITKGKNSEGNIFTA
jgi:hypothetical protein